jgi:hypothetical protein
MIFWAGAKMIKGKEVHGHFVWFVDIVMDNTTSQEARDLMPCLEAITSELSKDYFVNEKGAGKTKGLFILSDNALTSVVHTPFIHALNQWQALVLSECSNVSLPNTSPSPSSLLGSDNSTRNANDDSSQYSTGAVEKSNNQDGNGNNGDGNDDNDGGNKDNGIDDGNDVRGKLDFSILEQLWSRYSALIGN